MSEGIRISKKHVVNPTIPRCAFCGKAKNEIALLGYLPGDEEAPHGLILDYEPCDECKAQWEQGVAIIEVCTAPVVKGQPPIQEGAYPTGGVAVVKEEAFGGNYPKGSRLLMLSEEFQQLFFTDDVAERNL